VGEYDLAGFCVDCESSWMALRYRWETSPLAWQVRASTAMALVWYEKIVDERGFNERLRRTK